jgi:two-component system phosphate regulon sensor histidine kinase PhoR
MRRQRGGLSISLTLLGLFGLSWVTLALFELRVEPSSLLAAVAPLALLAFLLAKAGNKLRRQALELGRLRAAAREHADALARARDERDTLRGALAGLGEGVLVLGPDRRVQLANAALRALLIPHLDPVGRTALEVLRSDALRRLLARASEGEVSPVEAEVDLDTTPPRRFLVRAHAHGDGLPLPGGGVRRGVIAVFIDVTELRRLEGTRREFVANVSHELRTPIAAASGAAEMLEAELADSPSAPIPPAAIQPFVGIVVRNMKRLARLVEDLLDLSRLDARAMKLASEPVAVAPVVRLLFEGLAARAADRGLSLVSTVPGELRVAADRRALEQVLGNLLENAVKYASPRATVTVSATPDDGRVRLAVADTGPGIAERHLPRLFERFYRVDPGRARDVGGTGLGLAIVKNLAEAMGGDVQVVSALGRGTTFTVTLRSPNGGVPPGPPGPSEDPGSAGPGAARPAETAA